MITFKCKMCGGNLTFEPGSTIAECPYCGTTQTLPKLDDNKLANLYDRANHFRRQNEYDKAAVIYEQILAEDRTDAEAYWSLVLCRYGIEYVEDPASRKRVPTVNRVQYASILADEDYKSALANADAAQRGVYEAEASAIAEIQRGILDISKQEEPFDVFICYKETDANGRRTPDSVLATELYHELTKEGFKVFFARITLEDKIGTAYEPYIFAALNSARVMVALGTKPEYFNAVWVKNEWSRYLALIKGGADKTLVPAYRDMDPYDLPEEFAHLQAQDMGKLGFMQDLIRGIKKILRRDEPKPQTVVQQTVAPANNAAPLVKRAFMSLEDGDFVKADDFCEQALNLDPENARAWLGKLMAQLKVRKEEDLKNQAQPFDDNGNYQKALRFGDEALKAQLKGDIEFINNRNEHDRQAGVFRQACVAIDRAQTVEECRKAREPLFAIRGFEGVEEKLKACEEKIESINGSNYLKALNLQQAGKWQEAIQGFTLLKNYRYRDSADKIAECEESIRADTYQKAEQLRDAGKWEEAARAFDALGSYRDSVKQAQACRNSLEEEKKTEEQRREQERLAAEARAKAEAAKQRNRMILIVAVIAIIAAGAVLYLKVIKPNGIYNSALSAMNAGNYDEATEAFKGLGDYKDASTQAQESQYQKGAALLASGDYDGATEVFNAISSYNDAATQAQESQYQKGTALLASGDYDGAAEAFTAISGYNDAATKAKESQYQKGAALLANGDYDGATEAFTAISGYTDAATQAQESKYQKGMALLAFGDYDLATAAFNEISSYSDAATQAQESQYQKGTLLLSKGNYEEAIALFRSICEYKDAIKLLQQAQETLYQEGISLMGEEPYGALLAFRKVGREYKDTSEYVDVLTSRVSANGARISAGGFHTVGLKPDGTVVAVGTNSDGRCDVGDWMDVIAVAAGGYHTVGLKSNGTAVATGAQLWGRCDVGSWTNLVAVSAGRGDTIGLKTNGRCYITGQSDVSDWTDIVAVATGTNHTVGLKNDGTVIAIGDSDDGQCDVGDWTDIVAVAAGGWHTVGLKNDGTVIAVGNNDYDQCNVSDWKDIVAIAASRNHTVGLRCDGTVIAVGASDDGRCDVGGWIDIVAVSAGWCHTVGLKSDGTVVATGDNEYGQCNVDDWDLWD